MVPCQLLLKQWVPGLLSDHFDLVFSEYPTHRSKKDSEGVEMGVAGSVSLLQNVTLSTQPVSSLDWSPDKRGLCICSSFDQTVRVLIVTKLQTIWPSALNWAFPRGLLTELRSVCTLLPHWRHWIRVLTDSASTKPVFLQLPGVCGGLAGMLLWWRCHTTGPALFLSPYFY